MEIAARVLVPVKLKDAPWVWNRGNDRPWIEPACLDIEVQDFELLPRSEHEHMLEVALSDSRGDSASLSYETIPMECLPSLEKIESWVIDSTRQLKRAIFKFLVPMTLSSLLG